MIKIKNVSSWLLGEHPMFVRTSFDVYQERAEIFLSELIAQVKDLQFYTQSGSTGGPIIMAQVRQSSMVKYGESRI